MTVALPPWTITTELPPPDADTGPDLTVLPAARGIVAFETDDGQLISMIATADIRRMARSRLEPAPDDRSPRHTDIRSITRRICALRTGSTFESDWAYLQHARVRLPATYHTLFDRWATWFVRCDPTAAHPQWQKVRVPGADLAQPEHLFGPFPDKHAAHRYIETLQDAFDLCRYHHELVQAPDGRACAYKEMGRCPAPCDGTVSMDHYHEQINASITCAATPAQQYLQDLSGEIEQASTARLYELAAKLNTHRERAEPLAQRPYRLVRVLPAFGYAIIVPGIEPQHATIFVVRQGSIIRYPIELDRDMSSAEDVTSWLRETDMPDLAAEIAGEHIALAAHHMLSTRKTDPFIALPVDDLTPSTLSRAARTVIDRTTRRTDNPENDHQADRGIELGPA